MLNAHALFFLSPCPYFLQLGRKCFGNIMGGVWDMGMKAATNAGLPSPCFLANVIVFFFLQTGLPWMPSMTRVKEFHKERQVVQDEGW